jgi:recombinational DNA repair protein RecR
MDYTAAPLEKLIEEFGKFQGVGRKGATRMAYQVLSMSDKDAGRCHPRCAHPAASVPHLPELYGR